MTFLYFFGCRLYSEIRRKGETPLGCGEKEGWVWVEGNIFVYLILNIVFHFSF